MDNNKLPGGFDQGRRGFFKLAASAVSATHLGLLSNEPALAAGATPARPARPAGTGTSGAAFGPVKQVRDRKSVV